MDNTEKITKEKVKDFLNGLSNDEARYFWRFLRTKKWNEWVATRLNAQKIQE